MIYKKKLIIQGYIDKIIRYMTIWGISALFHDAAISVIQNNNLVFASSAERYSRQKNDKHLNNKLIADALKYGIPDKIVWYEKPYKKFLRQLAIDRVYVRHNIKNYLQSFGLHSRLYFCDHHLSHLYSSLFTAPFDTIETLGVVVDTVGEFLSTSIWDIRNNNNIKKLYAKRYPNSLGLFYSSITDLVGLQPQNDEYILMGMASYSSSDYYYHKFRELFFRNNNLIYDLRFGCKELFTDEEINTHKFDMARGAQLIFEEILLDLLKQHLHKTNYKKIVYAGGCALNCTANSKLLALTDKVWIFPNPGDAGASTGAALSVTKRPINLKNMFLGHNACEIDSVDEIVENIIRLQAVGVINGNAEFGPRALGNRSILADPRVKKIQNIVNDHKGREQFRPFAPAILQHGARLFDLKTYEQYKYMQYTEKCIASCDIPGVVHVDGTSRVQTVDNSNLFFYKLLSRWYDRTGCPVLLNTSLNYKGYPLVNSVDDLKEFKNRQFKVYTAKSCL